MSSDWYRSKLRPQTQSRPQPRPPAGYVPGGYPQPQPQVPLPHGKPPNGATTMENFWEMMKQWKGGKAHKIDAEPCPQCGSQNYYSRTGEGPRRGPPPAPHCFACGYNGLFDQGLASSWQE